MKLWLLILASIPAICGAADRPNLLFILADDFGYEIPGCYGGKDFRTPNIDALAADGMRFDRAYTSPVCTPSRMSLYTGLYTSTHGYDTVLPVHTGTRKKIDFTGRFTTFAQLFRKAGYRTSVTGKWQLAALEFHPGHCRDAGFDSWCVWQIWREGAKTTRFWNPCLNQDGKVREDIAERFGPDVLGEYVIERMRTAAAAEQPFYIHHNMMLPHVPIVQTPAEKASGKTASLHHMVAYQDKLIGQLLTEIDRLDISENTYVVFMGDNGTEASAAPERKTTNGVVTGGKRDLNDAGMHVPLIIRRPGTVEAGSVASDLIDMADLFPTLCELGGVALPEGHKIDGRSFAPRLLSGKAHERKWVTGGISGKFRVFDGENGVTMDRGGKVISGKPIPQDLEKTARELLGK